MEVVKGEDSVALELVSGGLELVLLRKEEDEVARLVGQIAGDIKVDWDVVQ